MAMKTIFVSGFILLATTFIFKSEAFDTQGIYCNNKVHTWTKAKESCASSCRGNGSLVSYDTGIGKTVAELSLRSDENIWTADYAMECRRNGLYGDVHNHKCYNKLCGFVYLNDSLLYRSVNREMLYGCCNVERNYFCEEVGATVVNQSTWHNIISECKKPVHHFPSFQPGFYWTMNSSDVIFEKGTTLPTSGSVLCGAYSPTIGQYFTNCDDTKPTSLCQCSGNAVKLLDKSCFIKQTTSTKMSSTTSTIRTTKMVNTKQTDKTMETTIGTSTHSFTRTVNNPQSGETKHIAEPTTNLNQITIQNHQFEERRKAENDPDLSVEVGLPVGLCLTLIIGITLTIYLVRRYKCLTRKPEFNENNNRNTKSTKISNYSFGGANAHINASYEANEEKVIKMNGNHKLNNVSKPPYRNIQNHSDANSEYAVVYKPKKGKVSYSGTNKQNAYCYASGYNDNCANSNEVQTADYSFAKYTSTEEAYDGIIEDEYDVTGNVLRDTSNVSSDIYNHFQNNDYDSTASVSGNNCNDMYDVTQNQRSESVYDSTEQVQSSTRCDNVYNHLS